MTQNTAKTKLAWFSRFLRGALILQRSRSNTSNCQLTNYTFNICCQRQTLCRLEWQR